MNVLQFAIYAFVFVVIGFFVIYFLSKYINKQYEEFTPEFVKKDMLIKIDNYGSYEVVSKTYLYAFIRRNDLFGYQNAIIDFKEMTVLKLYNTEFVDEKISLIYLKKLHQSDEINIVQVKDIDFILFEQ